MDRGENVETQHLEFPRAFGSVNYRLRAKKVKSFGVDSEAKSWTSQSMRRATSKRVASVLCFRASAVPDA